MYRRMKLMMIVDDLRDYFSRWGKVTQCIIKLDRFTGNSRGFGFVTMESEDCVSKVLCVSEHWLNNKKIDPKKAKPSREPLRKVFVGGIDPDVTEEQIREYFSSFGKVESLDLPFDAQKGRRKHYIFVSFATEAAARKAIALERQEIFGRQCDVRVAVTREQASRQKALKQWYGFFDYAYPGYTFGDFANPYSGYDPYVYGFYGYDYQNTAAAAASYEREGIIDAAFVAEVTRVPCGSELRIPLRDIAFSERLDLTVTGAAPMLLLRTEPDEVSIIIVSCKNRVLVVQWLYLPQFRPPMIWRGVVGSLIRAPTSRTWKRIGKRHVEPTEPRDRNASGGFTDEHDDQLGPENVDAINRMSVPTDVTTLRPLLRLVIHCSLPHRFRDPRNQPVAKDHR
ncbi:heterogeneous nuclear ribonucleoprotein D0 [Clonorchis sinensis]|uniref:Heterogeneous nuclear ribonucleoprotein D0 n=1 Tax=Clonorchis sinensis TaxID=79923 RepID=G7YPJ5_CLOSI|nr:heterogeneous nuclear ribonucleoprotein D0 [Clonorchis sinensis]